MATQTLDPTDVDLGSSLGTLILVWQNPVTHRFAKVGQLDALPQGRFAFRYLPTAWEDLDFNALLEYPDRDAAYVSDEVPAFFSNRILSANRPNYDRYLGWLGILDRARADVPFEVLARTGGGRATDTFHVVDLPVDTEQSFESRFFVSGVRHTKEPAAVVGSLREGDRLVLQLEEDNVVNPKAVVVDTVRGEKVGYVPDWLCADVHQRLRDGWAVEAVTERVNADAPPHVRVLCHIRATR